MRKNSFDLHKKLHGKIYVGSKIPNLSVKDIKLIYTPGVADVCRKIFKQPNLKFSLTSKGNNVAIVTDGTRLLGLGNLGPDAALPVMEGKSVLYQHYGKVNAFPICLREKNKNEIIKIIHAIEPAFGAINLEDIESPKVLDISNELEKKLSIPVFHDDRHGTSVVVLAALLNSLKIVQKKISKIKVIIAGAGSAGYGIAKLLHYSGCKNILILDSKGVICKNRKNERNQYKKELANLTNPKQSGSLSDVIKGADVFIGVSGIRNILKENMIKSMNSNPIVFALTNPDPEINPKKAQKAGAKIVATGSYKYQNSVNNALVFPPLMRAILDLRIKKVTAKVLYSAACAISKTVPKNKLSKNKIIPEIGDKKIQRNIINEILRTKSR